MNWTAADLDPKVSAHIMNMLSFALVAMDNLIPADDNAPTFEEVVEGIGDMLERSLTPPGGGNPEAGKAILRALSEAARARGNARTKS